MSAGAVPVDSSSTLGPAVVRGMSVVCERAQLGGAGFGVVCIAKRLRNAANKARRRGLIPVVALGFAELGR